MPWLLKILAYAFGCLLGATDWTAVLTALLHFGETLVENVPAIIAAIAPIAAAYFAWRASGKAGEASVSASEANSKLDKNNAITEETCALTKDVVKAVNGHTDRLVAAEKKVSFAEGQADGQAKQPPPIVAQEIHVEAAKVEVHQPPESH